MTTTTGSCKAPVADKPWLPAANLHRPLRRKLKVCVSRPAHHQRLTVSHTVYFAKPPMAQCPLLPFGLLLAFHEDSVSNIGREMLWELLGDSIQFRSSYRSRKIGAGFGFLERRCMEFRGRKSKEPNEMGIGSENRLLGLSGYC